MRLPHVLEWLAQSSIDVLGLQETKLIDEKFPREDIEAAGYHVVFAGQPTYNGVAILARQDQFHTPQDIQINNPRFPDEQMRLIAATLTPRTGISPLRFISAYVPNGSEVGSDKYAYKLRWLDALIALLREELSQHPALAIVGDYNIAPDDRDVYDPVGWQGQVLCSEPERERFQQLTALGLVDAFRLFDQPGNNYSWWDYRQAAFRRNLGLRIDHLLLSTTLAAACSASDIDTAPRKKEQPSDHAPAWAEIRMA